MQPQDMTQPGTPMPPASGTVPSPFPNPQNSTVPQTTQPRNPNSSQNTLLISEIREGMVVMNDGSFRAVVACQSINFDLMSEREREGVEFSYQSFLNSLYFPVQIFIRSQRVDIGPYLDRLAKIRRDQDNMLLGVLMDDYINFIDVLSQEANIMDKSFFIVVPFYPAGDVTNALSNSKNMLTSLFRPDKHQSIQIDKASYEKAKTELQNRVSAVTSGLFQIGVRGVQLQTKELASLYYNVYNPDTAVREPLGDFQDITGTYVQKGTGQAPQANTEGVN